MQKLFFLLVAAAALAFCPVLARTARAEDKESVYSRVLRTGVIRCAYFVVPPEFMKDPNTGKLSGIGYEVTEAAAKLLHLRIDWTEEVGFGEMTAGLSAGRYDAVCSSVFNRAPLARQADFTIPFMYTPVGVFVRQDDHRFDKGMNAIDDAAITIAAIDGAGQDEIAMQDFPQARMLSLPQNSDIAMLLESVATKKADVTFTYMANFHRYDKSNPGRLKALHPEKPVRAFGNTIMVAHGEAEFKSMLNIALGELLNDGIVDTIIAKYETYPGAYYRVNQPYHVP